MDANSDKVNVRIVWTYEGAIDVIYDNGNVTHMKVDPAIVTSRVALLELYLEENNYNILQSIVG